MWTEIKGDLDVFFKPKTKRDQVDAEPPQWRTIDIKLNKQRLGLLKQSLKRMSKDELALRQRAALIGKRFISHHHIFWVNRLA